MICLREWSHFQIYDNSVVSAYNSNINNMNVCYKSNPMDRQVIYCFFLMKIQKDFNKKKIKKKKNQINSRKTWKKFSKCNTFLLSFCHSSSLLVGYVESFFPRERERERERERVWSRIRNDYDKKRNMFSMMHWRGEKRINLKGEVSKTLVRHFCHCW